MTKCKHEEKSKTRGFVKPFKVLRNKVGSKSPHESKDMSGKALNREPVEAESRCERGLFLGFR